VNPPRGENSGPGFCDLSAEGAGRAFAPATLCRLADVKDRYDPGIVFRLSFGGLHAAPAPTPANWP